MPHDDVITGAVSQEKDMYEVTQGFGTPSWKTFPVEQIRNREDFRVCTGIFEEEAEGADVLNFSYGPSTGGLLESCRFNIYTYGERILSLRPEPRYKDRQLQISGSSLDMANLMLERYCGPLSAFYSGMFCAAVESMLDCDQDNDLRLARIIMNEIARIADHLNVIARLAEGASQNVAYNLIFALREKLLRIVSKRFGHRYFFGINHIGGLARAADFSAIAAEIGQIASEFSQIWLRLENSGIFIDRLQGTATCRKSWMVGPSARAAGLDADTRKAASYLEYDDLGFKVAVSSGADTLSRALVRKDEIFASAAIIENAGKMIHDIPLASGRKITDLSGEISVRAETPGGDSLMRVSVTNGMIKRIYIRPSSIQNLAVFSHSIRGNLLTDFTFGYEGLGIQMSELGGVL
ncbi:MAG: formate hydrogenlyase [Candidatus Thermoplasmatota archaeon]|nr:formate hydrogenlyase [Candidatus Thermoplasmatota archaeon]